MSKQIHVCLLVAVLAAATSTAASAAGMGGTEGYGMPAPASAQTKPVKPQSYGAAIGHKLGAGLANVGLGFLEIPKNVVNVSNEGNLAMGMTLGIVRGALHMFGRNMAGVLDVVTFPLPTEPLTTPEYVWESRTQETQYNSMFKTQP